MGDTFGGADAAALPAAQAPYGDVSAVVRGLSATGGYHLLAGQFSWSVPGASAAWPGYAAGSEPFSGYGALSAAQAARFGAAIAAWDALIAPNFSRTDDASNPGFIRVAYDDQGDNGYAAYTLTANSASAQQSARVGDIWINSHYPSTAATDFAAGSGGYETLMHEIGHAIGLKHSFETPTVPAGTDSSQYTIMSYTEGAGNRISFSQSGNTLTGTSTPVYATTPMVFDIAAVQSIYGAATDTAAGDTVYRFDQDASTFQSIYDAGGTDTIDLSNFTRGSSVDLRPGAYSSIGYWSAADQKTYWEQQFAPGFKSFVDSNFTGHVYDWSNNLGIAYSTVIENAVGGSGADRLIGNAADNHLSGGAGEDILTGGLGHDVLSGGPGDDLFSDTLAGFDGDTITDLAPGDSIRLEDGTLPSDLRAAYTAGVLDLGGARVTLSGAPSGFFARNAAIAANIIDFRAHEAAQGDLDGDGWADLLLAGRGNAIGAWTGTQTATIGLQASGFRAGAASNWHALGTLDMNGDGRADILWHDADRGTVAVWFQDGRGGYGGANYLSSGTALSWSIAAVGDWNGDGRDDLIWRNNAGAVSTWLSNGTGFDANRFYADVSTAWHIQGSGDFNGDGKTDILWRTADGAIDIWQSTGSGFRTSAYTDTVRPDWHVAAIADFTGDGKADILWRNDGGALSLWTATADGFQRNSYYDASVPAGRWQVAGAADFDNDGRADILWHSTDGLSSVWTSTGTGFVSGAYTTDTGIDWSPLILSHDLV